MKVLLYQLAQFIISVLAKQYFSIRIIFLENIFQSSRIIIFISVLNRYISSAYVFDALNYIIREIVDNSCIGFRIRILKVITLLLNKPSFFVVKVYFVQPGHTP